MRYFLCIGTIVLVLVSAALGMSRKEVIDMQTTHLVEPLKLTAGQTESVRAIITRALGKLQQLSGDPRESRQRADDLDRAVREQISAQLSEDQKVKLFDLRESVLPDPQMLTLNDRLDLTPAQYERITRIRASYRAQMQSMRGGSSGDRQGMGQQMQTLMEQQSAEIRAVLTDKQKAEYDRLREEQQQQRRPPNGRPGNGSDQPPDGPPGDGPGPDGGSSRH
jgi:hypothetical protein